MSDSPHYDVDVLVVGAGSAGSTRGDRGARERRAARCSSTGSAFLGGTSTAVLDTFYAFYTPGRDAAKGRVGHPRRGRRAADRPRARRSSARTRTAPAPAITYDPETLKRVWERSSSKPAPTCCCTAFVPRRRASTTSASTRDPRLARRAASAWFEPRVVVDASGDADVCHLAGAPYERAGRGRAGSEPLDRVPARQRRRRRAAEAVPKAELWRAACARRRRPATTALPRLEGSVHRTPQRGRDDGADDADRATSTRPTRSSSRAPRSRAAASAASTTASSASACRATSRRCSSRRARRSACARAAASSASTCSPREEMPRRAPLPRRDRAVRRADRGAPRRQRHALGAISPRARPTGSRTARCCRSASRTCVVAGRCFSATHDAHASARSMGDVHGDGPGGGNGRGAGRCGGIAPRELDPRCSRSAAGRADVGGRAIREERASRSCAVDDRTARRRLVAAGIAIVEITLDSDGALGTIERLRRRDGLTVLAGTVRTAAQVDAAVGAGAEACVVAGVRAGDRRALPRARRPGRAGRPHAVRGRGALAGRCAARQALPGERRRPGLRPRAPGARSRTCRCSSPAASRPPTRAPSSTPAPSRSASVRSGDQARALLAAVRA